MLYNGNFSEQKIKKGAEEENEFAMFLFGECLERGIGIDEAIEIVTNT